jgi:hypothetical protein
MRLTVNLESELYAIAVAYARNAGCSISDAVNLLLRRSLTPAVKPSKRRASGFPVVRGERPFSDEDVERIERG